MQIWTSLVCYWVSQAIDTLFYLVKNYELFYNQVLWVPNCWVGFSRAPFSSRICSISSAASSAILLFWIFSLKASNGVLPAGLADLIWLIVAAAPASIKSLTIGTKPSRAAW